MKFKHTPGPWLKCNANEGNCPCGLIWDNTGNFVISKVTSTCVEHEGSNLCTGINRGTKEYIANARLIAAAPEMFESIIKAVSLQTKDGWLYNHFKDVIEKATGMSIEEVLDREE